jgi:hypothetical protein
MREGAEKSAAVTNAGAWKEVLRGMDWDLCLSNYSDVVE